MWYDAVRKAYIDTETGKVVLEEALPDGLEYVALPTGQLLHLPSKNERTLHANPMSSSGGKQSSSSGKQDSARGRDEESSLDAVPMYSNPMVSIEKQSSAMGRGNERRREERAKQNTLSQQLGERKDVALPGQRIGQER